MSVLSNAIKQILGFGKKAENAQDAKDAVETTVDAGKVIKDPNSSTEDKVDATTDAVVAIGNSVAPGYLEPVINNAGGAIHEMTDISRGISADTSVTGTRIENAINGTSADQSQAATTGTDSAKEPSKDSGVDIPKKDYEIKFEDYKETLDYDLRYEAIQREIKDGLDSEYKDLLDRQKKRKEYKPSEDAVDNYRELLRDINEHHYKTPADKEKDMQ